jgi:hypothetical protein
LAEALCLGLDYSSIAARRNHQSRQQPSVHRCPFFTKAGGLLSYEPSRPSPSGAAIYVDLIERTW